MAIHRLGIASLLFVFIGCGGQGKTSDYIPHIPMECASSQVADCAGDNLPVFAGLIESLGGIPCDDFLAGMNASLRRQTFLATAQSVADKNSIYLTATWDLWTDSTGGRMDSLAPGDHVICAFVDANSNDLLDVNEPVGEATFSVGQTGFILRHWYPAYN